MSQKSTRWILWLAVGILLFGSGYKIGEYKTELGKREGQTYTIVNSNSTVSDAKKIDFSLFWDTWNKLEQKYIDSNKLDPQKMFYGAIKGMVASVEDNYTFFLTPQENKDSKNDLSGKFEGIGAQLGLKNNLIIIVAPLKGSPAQKAGVKSGDIVLKVDGQSTKGWSLPTAVSKIRGPKGTKVKLTLFRTSKEFEVEIVRAEIQVSSVDLSYDKETKCNTSCPKVAHLKVNQFGEKTNEEWNAAVSEVRTQWKQGKIKGLVLDLRDNPGGFLDSSVYLASEFLPQGRLVVKQESTVGQNKDYYVNRPGELLDIPLNVLINKGSASASEILAGALKDYKRSKLIGEQSFGKGSVQEALDLKDGSGLHVTVAKWILPNGDWINGKGVTPDIKIENQLKEGDTLTRERDSQLEKAIELLVE